MPSNDESKILPPMTSDRGRPQANRTILGILLALLSVAVLLALWFLIIDNGDSSVAAQGQAPKPTPLTLATAVPAATNSAAPTAVAAATTAPVVNPTPVPDGFEACAEDRSPLVTSSYIVDTNTTPLNQRAEPSASAEQAGTFDPGQRNLVFTGECVVNTADGYTWWKIFNGTDDVWVASNFVSPN